MAHTLDQEFNNYWKQLNPEQKKSVISIIKSFITSVPINKIKYNKEIDEAMARMDAGNYLDHEDIENEAAKW